jgi:MIP family channel proteins
MVRSLTKAAAAEAVGAFALIFVGVLAITAVGFVQGPPGLVNLAGIGLAHGLTIAVMIAALGAVSGGHFNPAITAGFVATGRMSVRDGLVYWLGQLAGATLAGLVLAACFGPALVAAGTPAIAAGVPIGVAILMEGIATFFLVLVVFGTVIDGRAPKSIYPFAIGLTITVGIIAIGALTGGALNPARAFGPALASGQWANQLVYWVGPIIGGCLAALLEDRFFIERRPEIRQIGGPTEEDERRAA